MSIFPTDLTHSATAVASSLLPGNVTSNAASAASSTGSTGSTDTNDLTSDDFLTLLVTEMKNQDPTQPTDPNAYIQQLTEVNSLQQLIAINQDLTGSGSSGTTPGTSAASSVTN